jgi:hypothetical protein
MNIQAMMKQAQKLQQDMLKEKGAIEEMKFTSKTSFVTIIMNGNKKIESVNIDTESLDKDEVEMLQDMIMVCVNDCIKQIDDETEKRLGKYTQGMPGLF